MTTFLKNILQLIISPGAGWSDVASMTRDPRIVANQCMYPTFGLAALSAFVPLSYNPDYSFATALVSAAAIFVSLFATYVLWNTFSRFFIANFIDGDPDYDNCTTVVIYGLSLLAFSEIVCNLSPFDLGLPYLLPLAVALVVWKAGSFLHVNPEKDLSFIGFVIIAIILPPALIQQLFAWAMTN